MVGEGCYERRCIDYLVSRSICSCVLDKPVTLAINSLTHFIFFLKRYVAYVMFTRKDLSLENTGYMGFIF